MKRIAIYNREEITCILEKGVADDTDTRIILDVDATFIDSNDVHAKLWAEAMAAYGYNVAFEKVRPLMGMGGDKVCHKLSIYRRIAR